MALKIGRFRRNDNGEEFDAVTIRVDHRVKRQTMIELLAASSLCQDKYGRHDSAVPAPAEAELIDAMRRGLWGFGQHGEEAAGNLYGLEDERWDWARRQADRLWPVKGGELTWTTAPTRSTSS